MTAPRHTGPRDLVHVVPLTVPVANKAVAAWHRHHAPIPGGFAWFCLGAVVAGQLRGVAIAGRPTNRNNDDRQTVEVLRVASDGTPNVCSALLGACGKAGRAIGARRVITYTLDEETGSSLRAVGWTREADGITSWWTHKGADGNGRAAAVERDHMKQTKVRWALNIREPIAYELPDVLNEPSVADSGSTLFPPP